MKKIKSDAINKKAKSDDNKNHIYDLLQEVLLNSIEVVVVK